MAIFNSYVKLPEGTIMILKYSHKFGLFWICFSLVDFILILRHRSSQITNFTRSSGSTGPPGCHHGWHHRQAKHHSTQEKCEVFPGRSWLCSSEISWNFTMQSSSAVVVWLFQDFIPESSTGGSTNILLTPYVGLNLKEITPWAVAFCFTITQTHMAF